jgi:hypothetical protein
MPLKKPNATKVIIPIVLGRDDDWGVFGFLRELGPRPSPRHVIRRINESRPYELGNLAWMPRKPKEKPEYLSVAQAHLEFGINKTTLYSLKKRKKIASMKLPGAGFRFLRSDLLEYIKEHTTPAVRAKPIPPEELVPTTRRRRKSSLPNEVIQFQFLKRR